MTVYIKTRNGKPAFSSRNWRNLGERGDDGSWEWNRLRRDWPKAEQWFFCVFFDPPPPASTALGGLRTFEQILGGL